MKKNLLTRYILSWLIPFLTKHPGFLIVGALLYLISPFDLMPEAMTGLIGFIDDIFAIAFVAMLIKKLRAFKGGPTTAHTPSTNPYKTLDILPGATDKEIIKAYRKKMAEYHPDKVNHLGEDLKKTAHQKTIEIQNAYDTLMKRK